jgi:NADP-dependent 3-hydroxy acid dehydrogenase YdfG
MTQKQQVAMITGASSGIGRAIALKLGQEGYRLALCARRLDRLQDLRDKLRAMDADVLVEVADLRQESDILAFFEVVRQRWGGVDVLINNAGLGHKQSLLAGDTEAWREMLEVNVLALCICTREAIQDMRRQGGTGQVIHISSMAAHRVPVGSGVYSATKFAVRSLTEGLRQELRQEDLNIRVAAVSPGFVETEFAARYHKSQEKADALYGQYPVLQPKDIANTVAYILNQPAYVQIHDVLVRPTQQQS